MLRHVQPFATPWTVARQAPLSMGFSRQEYWSGLPCPPPGDLPDPGIKPESLASLALAGKFFTTSATWESHADWDSITKQTAWDGHSYKSISLSWDQGKRLSRVLVKPWLIPSNFPGGSDSNKSCEQSSLAGCRPWGGRKSDTTEAT